LRRPEPFRVELGEVLEAMAKGPAVLEVIVDPRRQRLRAVRRVDAARARARIEPVLEARLLAGRHVSERERLDRDLEVVGHTGRVVVPLRLNVRKDSPGRFGLEDANGLAVDEEEVVGPAVWWVEDELAHRHTLRLRQIDCIGVLDGPARSHEHRVDLAARLRFRCQIRNRDVTQTWTRLQTLSLGSHAKGRVVLRSESQQWG